MVTINEGTRGRSQNRVNNRVGCFHLKDSMYDMYARIMQLSTKSLILVGFVYIYIYICSHVKENLKTTIICDFKYHYTLSM